MKYLRDLGRIFWGSKETFLSVEVRSGFGELFLGEDHRGELRGERRGLEQAWVEISGSGFADCGFSISYL